MLQISWLLSEGVQLMDCYGVGIDPDRLCGSPDPYSIDIAQAGRAQISYA